MFTKYTRFTILWSARALETWLHIQGSRHNHNTVQSEAWLLICHMAIELKILSQVIKTEIEEMINNIVCIERLF